MKHVYQAGSENNKEEEPGHVHNEHVRFFYRVNDQNQPPNDIIEGLFPEGLS